MEQQTKQEEMQQEQKKTSFLSDMAEVLETVFVSIFVVILLFAYVIRPVTVEGDSMRETLHNKDRLLMSDLLYTPKYGDIVIVNNEHSYSYDENGDLVEGSGLPQEKRLIKRVIATGGQEINIDFETGTGYRRRRSSGRTVHPSVDAHTGRRFRVLSSRCAGGLLLRHG